MSVTVIPNQDFKHGAKTYKTNKKYKVSVSEAGYFQDAGWIGERRPTGSVQSLEIRDSVLVQAAEVKHDGEISS